MTSELVVPIFPLPGVQLFPNALMPLHVFEPRYRELVRDALAGERLIAPAMLEPGYEAAYEGRPPVFPVCGIGRLIAHEALPDGRSNILLRGIGRARILGELAPDASYRRVRLAPLDDLADRTSDAQEGEALSLLAGELARRLPSGADDLRALVRDHPHPGALSDVLAAALVRDPSERQALLEEQRVGERVRRVTVRLASLLARSTSGSN
jgi:Lon protease-like protein